MSRTEELVLWLTATIDMLGPVVIFLLLRRLTRNWQVAFLVTIVVTPVAAYFLTGGEAWLSTYYRVVVRGDTSVPESNGQTVPEYLNMTFGVCGVFGVLIAYTGFGLSLPFVGIWRLIHPRSFNRLTRGNEYKSLSQVLDRFCSRPSVR